MFYACSTGVVCFRFSTGTEILVLSLYCTCMARYMCFLFSCYPFLCVRTVYSTILFYLIKICVFVNNFLFFPRFIETCFCCCTRVRYWYGRFSFFSQGQFFFGEMHMAVDDERGFFTERSGVKLYTMA